MVASSITQQHFSIVLPVICIIYIQLRMTGFKIQSIWIMLICQQSFINSESKTQADWGPGSGHIGPFNRIVSVHHSAAKVNADISIFRSLILTCWCLASIILVLSGTHLSKKSDMDGRTVFWDLVFLLCANVAQLTACTYTPFCVHGAAKLSEWESGKMDTTF